VGILAVPIPQHQLHRLAPLARRGLEKQLMAAM
jgi:hypothetical protein